MRLDAAWADVVAELPAGLRADAEELPRRLGISERSSGWSDYATLPPVLALPKLAAEPVGAPPELVELALTAHLRGGFVGLAIDRMADGQASDRAGLAEVVGALRRLWEASLGDLMGDVGAARAAVDDGIAGLTRAAAAEQREWTPASLTVDAYVHSIEQKTAWFGTAALALLDRASPSRRAGFAGVVRLLMLSLQTFDDAEDEAEDRALRGASAADALGMSARALGLASVLFAEEAARLARDGGFCELAGWLRARVGELRHKLGGGGAALDAFAALALAAAADPA